MITTKEVPYIKKVITWYCDFCDYHTQNNKGCCGVRNVMGCEICGKHICRKCTTHYQEDDWSDYDDAQICPKCNVEFKPAWEWALYNAKRHENIMDAALRHMRRK